MAPSNGKATGSQPVDIEPEPVPAQSQHLKCFAGKGLSVLLAVKSSECGATFLVFWDLFNNYTTITDRTIELQHAE